MSYHHPPGAVAVLDAPQAVRTSPIGKTFGMWPLSQYGHEAYRQALCADSLEDAVRIATPPVMNLDIARGGFPAFVILESDDRARPGKARHVLHFYIVKVKREWRSAGVPTTTRKVAVPYAVHQGSLPMDAFDPRRPFSVAFGDSAVDGRQPDEPQLVEAASVTVAAE